MSIFLGPDGKRINIYAQYQHGDTIYPALTNPELRQELGISETSDPTPPAEYLTNPEYYYVNEQDTAPYVIYTRKPDLQIKELGNTKIKDLIDSLESQSKMARPMREYLLSLADATTKPWYSSLKALDDQIAALRAQIQK